MSLNYDPVENTDEYQRVKDHVAELAWRAVEREGVRRQSFGSCHAFWRHFQQLLWERHLIRWRSPAEMNSDAIFD